MIKIGKIQKYDTLGLVKKTKVMSRSEALGRLEAVKEEQNDVKKIVDEFFKNILLGNLVKVEEIDEKQNDEVKNVKEEDASRKAQIDDKNVRKRRSKITKAFGTRTRVKKKSLREKQSKI